MLKVTHLTLLLHICKNIFYLSILSVIAFVHPNDHILYTLYYNTVNPSLFDMWPMIFAPFVLLYFT